MATRCYLPDGVAAPVNPPSPAAAWEHVNTSGNYRQKLLTTPDTSALTTVDYSPDAADDLTDKDSLHRQYVSNQLAAQTISGNLTGRFQGLETFANNNLLLTIKVMVISSDGTTVLATLLAITRVSTEFATTLCIRAIPSTALSSYACASGDRLCIEFGLGGNITSGTGGVIGHNGSLRWGCDAADGDLTVDQVGETTYRAWVEFSNTITWLGTAYTLDAASGSYTKTGQAATTRAQRLLKTDAGSYTESGAAAKLLAQRLLAANAATYMLTGNNAALLAGRFMNAAKPPQYTVSGKSAGLLAQKKLNAGAGSYTETGVAASLLAARLLKATGGAYTTNGSAAALLAQRLINGEPGVYIIKGIVDPTIVREFLLSIQKEKGINVRMRQEKDATIFIVQTISGKA